MGNGPPELDVNVTNTPLEVDVVVPPIQDFPGDVRLVGAQGNGPRQLIFEDDEPPRLVEAYTASIFSTTTADDDCSLYVVRDYLSSAGVPTQGFIHRIVVNPGQTDTIHVNLPRPILIKPGSTIPGDATNIGMGVAAGSADLDCFFNLTFYTRLAE